MAAIRSAKPHAQNSRKQNRGRRPSSPCFARSRRYTLHDPVHTEYNKPHDYIFSVADNGNKPFSTYHLRYICTRVSKAAGICHVTPHMLRHTFATRLIEKAPTRKRLYASGAQKRCSSRCKSTFRRIWSTLKPKLCVFSNQKILKNKKIREIFPEFLKKDLKFTAYSSKIYIVK
ncbi:MAG: tyrosine-type recombinase/integrase [Hominenteromicrobium sp.]|uniref:tyrosine-type recombinase/integrase n=1 Tax=Hominenteromicrobium sp. TaxID=3073581 RepID=UPI00399271B1